MYHDSDRCWQIFTQKNSDYDGVFVVGVMSTKIYCRPSCTARPLRKNVRFFADNTSATHAGLRPCKRCAPDSLSPDLMLAQRVCRYIESTPRTPSLSQIAQAMGYSPFHLQRTFKRIMGISPFGYAQTVKWLRLHHLLSAQTTVKEAITQAGFGSVSSYYRSYTQHNLLRIHHRHDDIHIGQATYHDYIVVGVFHEMHLHYCGIYEDEAQAQSAIQLLVGRPISSMSETHSHILATLLKSVDFATISPVIAKDIRATVFQQRVWQAIRQIPIGQTRQYHEIADVIGQPQATRAVANACGQNPLAILTPCHRVVPADNSVGEYRWGTPIKAKLLLAEQATTYNKDVRMRKEH
jgi:AraC family transcriptional regulator, regulatory protein of adaptative response / methylated-DNA-[protein]-cysteine methyltransferase